MRSFHSADLSVREHLDGIFQIETSPMVFSVLIVGKDSALLVDTGFGISDLDRCVGGLIGDRRLLVANTHGHLDHILGNYQFEEVLIDPRDMAWQVPFSLSSESKGRVLAKEPCASSYPRIGEFLAYDGGNLRPMEEAEFQLGDMTVDVVGIPNHSKGSVGFFVKERDLLVSGDALAPCISLLFPESASVEEHLDILGDLTVLGFRHVLSSHDGRLHDRSILYNAIKCARSNNGSMSIGYEDPYYLEFKGRLFAYIEEGHSESASFLITKKQIGMKK